MNKLHIAVCQHSLSGDIEKNLKTTLRQVKDASLKGADIALFPECNLTGYAGLEFHKYHDEDYKKLQEAIKEIEKKAKELNLWIIVGGYRFESNFDLPYNSLFVITDKGRLEYTYDKRLLTAGDSGWDNEYFTPGKDPITFSIKGIKCGILICHEWRYPELYREYKSLGADLIFQSWYDANVRPDEYRISGSDHGSLIMGAVRNNAANNYLWIAGSNASNRESSIGSFVARPDGKLVSKLARNKNGILIETVDLSERFIDPSKHNRTSFLQG